MKPMYAYIPSNLDLSSARHRDKYYFIISFIYYGRVFDRRRNSASFIQLYSPFLKSVINGRYKEYLQDLIEKNIIETDNRYIKGKKSKGYRLTENYRNTKTKQVRIIDEKIITNYSNYKAEQKKRITESHFIYLLGCLEKIEIDYEAAINFLNNHAENFEQYNTWYCSIERIYNKDWFFTVDKTAGRVHNNLTNLPKNLRPFLKYDNQKLVEIDIRNCQPLLLNFLISKYLLKDIGVYNSGINIPPVPQNSDLRLYKEITEQGKFYEFMMNKLDIDEDREQFKKRMFIKIFYGRENESEERSQFKQIFPEVSEIIAYYKKVNYKDLSVALQREEAEIMLNYILPKLAEEKIFVLTIHDSILTMQANVELVKEVIMSEFKKHGLQPTLKIKS